jgi:hypothetical protein
MMHTSDSPDLIDCCMWLYCCLLLQTLLQARVAIRARNSITLFADGDYNLNLSECTTTPPSSKAASTALLDTTASATPYVPVPATVPFTVASTANGGSSGSGARIIGDVLFAPRRDSGAAADNNSLAAKPDSTLHNLDVPSTSLHSRSLQWNSTAVGVLCATVLLALAACGLLMRSARRKSTAAAAAQQQREKCSEQVETPTAAHRRSIGWVWGKGDDDDDT